jgi:hypothetical protein
LMAGRLQHSAGYKNRASRQGRSDEVARRPRSP